MEQSNLPSNPAQVTPELVKAAFNIDITRLDYQKILQAVENIQWTRENIDQPLLEPAKFVAGKLTEKKDQLKRPYIDAGKVIQTEYNSVFNPLNDAISRKANERKEKALAMQKEDDLANAEAQRVSNIRRGMATFISNTINEITQADSDKVIVALEMRVGSEITRKNVYQEFIDEFKGQCEELKPLIKKQKEYIKALKDAAKKGADAAAKGDDDAAIAMREKADTLRETIEENKIRLQEKAFEQVENSDTGVAIPTISAPKASRTWWTWEVPDIATLYKKHPELVQLTPNKEAIDQMLNELKEKGDTEGKREVIVKGIRFFEEKSFK